MDLTESIAPKSDQLNADDLMTGARTFTIERVTKGTVEQPFNFHLAEAPGRPYRPSKSMRRVMVAMWGKHPEAYVGHRLTLYRDPAVKFGGEEVGGIKISHASHIDGVMRIPLTVTRGTKKPHTVDPLPDVEPSVPEPTEQQVRASSNLDELRDWWRFPGLRAAITERKAELEARAAEQQQGGEEQ